jgi:HEAT repeat protein
VTLIERLRSPELSECLPAIDALVERGSVTSDELDALAECLGHPRKAAQRRAAEAFAALSTAGIDVRQVLGNALRSTLPRERWGAAFALSLVGTPPAEALPVLLECLGSDDGDVRWAAASAVVRVPQRAALTDALCSLLRTGGAVQRKMCAYCLRDLDFRSPAVEAALAAALDDPDSAVRIAAMAGLTRLAANRADVARRLIILLGDAHEGVRRAAAASLGALGERSAPVIDTLRAATTSPDPSLRRAAERSLRLLGS